jgi:hypothetical protein
MGAVAGQISPSRHSIRKARVHVDPPRKNGVTASGRVDSTNRNGQGNASTHWRIGTGDFLSSPV